MMPECDLDDNDPLSDYLKRAPMITAKKPPVSQCICCLGIPPHDLTKFDSINSISGSERQSDINHNEIDTGKDKLEASADVSKQQKIYLQDLFLVFAFSALLLLRNEAENLLRASELLEFFVK
jgi:hypothetical protein